MLPKTARLPREEFQAGGYKTIRTPHFLLKFKKNKKDLARIGVVVSMAVHKRAVKRNFWKRQAKAVLAEGILLSPPTRDEVGERKIPSGHDILVIFSPKVNELTKKQFKEKLGAALQGALQ